MEEDNQKVRRALEEAINKHVRGRADSQQIEAVIWTNFQHSRVTNYLELGDENTPDDYVQRVVQNYEYHHQYVTCVQNGDENIWLELYPKMQHWPIAICSKKGFTLEREPLN